MKTNAKKITFSGMAIALAVCLLAAFLWFMQPVQAEAAAAGTISGFTMEEVAEVRQYGFVGIRFIVNVDSDSKPALTDAQYGTLLIPENLLEGELTLDTAKVLNIATSKWQNEEETQYTAVLAGKKDANGNYTDLSASYYNRPLVSRGYVTGKNSSGETVTYYTANTVTKSIGYVATMNVANGSDNDTLKTIADATDKSVVLGDAIIESGTETTIAPTVIFGGVTVPSKRLSQIVTYNKQGSSVGDKLTIDGTGTSWIKVNVNNLDITADTATITVVDKKLLGCAGELTLNASDIFGEEVTITSVKEGSTTLSADKNITLGSGKHLLKVESDSTTKLVELTLSEHNYEYKALIPAQSVAAGKAAHYFCENCWSFFEVENAGAEDQQPGAKVAEDSLKIATKTEADYTVVAQNPITSTKVTATTGTDDLAFGGSKSTNVFATTGWTGGFSTISNIELEKYSELMFYAKVDSGKDLSYTVGSASENWITSTDWTQFKFVLKADGWSFYLGGNENPAVWGMTGDQLSDILKVPSAGGSAGNVYVSELFGILHPDYDYDWVDAAESVLALTGTASSDVSAPSGFDTVVKVNGSWNATGYAFNSFNLTPYTQVRFAIKHTTANFGVMQNGALIGGETNNGSNWMVISLIKNGENWDLYYGETLQKSLKLSNNNLTDLTMRLNGNYYLSELQGVVDPDYVDPWTWVQGENPVFTLSGSASTEAAPEGFTTVTSYTTSWNKYSFNSLDISGYEEVKFAVKSAGYFGVMSDASTVISETNNSGNWLVISLVKNGTNWDVCYGGAVKATLTLANNNLTDLYFRFGGNTYHVTELWAKMQTPEETEPETPAVNSYDTIYSSPFTSTGDAGTAAPEGFENVTVLSMSWNKYNFRYLDLAAYSEVRFAVKTADKGFGVMYDESNVINEGSYAYEWLVISFVKNGESWDIYYGEDLVKTLTLTNNNLTDLYFRFGSGTYYVTELQGIKDESYVDLSVEALKPVFDLNGIMSTETAPDGFNSVAVYETTGNKYSFKSLDISKYYWIQFAVKSAGTYGVMSDANTVIGEGNNDGNWLIITLIPNGSNWDLYYDGVLQKTLTLANNNLTDLYFRFNTNTYAVTEMRGLGKHEHKWINNVNAAGALVSAGSCIEKSVYKKSCVCGELHATETFEGAYGSHSYTFVAEVPATPEATGMKAHYRCPDCNKYFVVDGDTAGTETTAEALVIAKSRYYSLSDNVVPSDFGTIETVNATDAADIALGISKINTVTVASWKHAQLTNVDLTGYNMVKFYIQKISVSGDLYQNGGNWETDLRCKPSTEGWTEVTLTLRLDGKWNVTIGGASTATTAYTPISAFDEIRIHSDNAGSFKISNLMGTKGEAKVPVFNLTGKESTVAAPDGFTTVTEYTTTWNKYSFNSLNLTDFTEVSFAIKSTGSYGVMPDEATVIEEGNNNGEWTVISFMKNGSNWDLYYNDVYKQTLTLANNDLTDLYFRLNGATYYVTELKVSKDPVTLSLVQNGATPFTIIHQDSNEVYFAEAELMKYFKLATGVEFATPTFYTGDAPKNSIIIGKKPAQDRGLSFEGLSGSDYRIAVVGTTIYIYSNSNYGLINGVYAFLEELFDLKIYYKDTYTLTEVSGDLIKTADELNMTGDRTFDYVWGGSGELNPSEANGYSYDYSYSMGFVPNYIMQNTSSIGPYGGWHNALYMIDYATYGASHPEWFYNVSGVGDYDGQLYLAVEDFASGEGTLVYTVAEKIWAEMQADTSKKTIICAFSHMDNGTWPTGTNYSKSDALLEKYGTNAAENIMFMNAVAKLIEAKLETNDIYNGEQVTMQLLCYHRTLIAPDTTGLSAEDIAAVQLFSGSNVKVVPYVAPVEGNYHMAFTDERNLVRNPVTYAFDSGSPTVAEAISGWEAFTDEIHLWMYSLDASNYYMPVDILTNMQANYQFAAAHHVTIMYDQNQYDVNTMTDWSRLKIFIRSELAKNVNADVNALIDEFMTAYFGAGATEMKKLLTAQQTWYAKLVAVATQDGVNYAGNLHGAQTLWKVPYFLETPKSSALSDYGASSDYIKTWMGYIDAAKAAINADTSLTDDEKNALIARVELEALTARYILADLFGYTTYGNKTQVIADANSLGMTKGSENESDE